MFKQQVNPRIPMVLPIGTVQPEYGETITINTSWLN